MSTYLKNCWRQGYSSLVVKMFFRHIGTSDPPPIKLTVDLVAKCISNTRTKIKNVLRTQESCGLQMPTFKILNNFCRVKISFSRKLVVFKQLEINLMNLMHFLKSRKVFVAYL